MTPVSSSTFSEMQQLHVAVFNGDLGLMGQLLDSGVSPDAPDHRAIKPLHLAASRGHHLAIELLLERRADINCRGPSDYTPLMIAILSHQLDSLKTLLNAKADIYLIADETTALHKAASFGNVVAMRFLIAQRADVNLLDPLRLTPIQHALYAKQLESVQFLLASGAEKRRFHEPEVWKSHVAYQAIHPRKSSIFGIGKDPISREVLAARVLAQSLKFGGTVPFTGGALKLEKGGAPYYSKIMLQSVQAFIQQYPDKIAPHEYRNLHAILHCEDDPKPSDILEDIHKGALVQISSGFRVSPTMGHCIIVTVIGDYLVISNKGAASTWPGEIYKIDRNGFTLAMISEMLDMQKSMESFRSWTRFQIFFLLSAAKNEFADFIQSLYPLDAYQVIGNCSWESPETSVFFTLAISRFLEHYDPKNPPNAAEVKALQDTFVHWLRFTQLKGVDKYFAHIDAGEIPFNLPLARLAFDSMSTIQDWYGMDDHVTRLKVKFHDAGVGAS